MSKDPGHESSSRSALSLLWAFCDAM